MSTQTTQNGLRTYRPQLDQYTYCSERVELAVKNWIEGVRKQTVSRSLLLSGPTGLGKTTLALSLCEALGAAKRDITEANCADLRGIDAARGLINQTLQFGPSVGEFRVLILDECHQMTQDAQQAFLTPLENLSPQTIVIGCTSNPEMLLRQFVGRFYEIRIEPYPDEKIVDILLNLPEPPSPKDAVTAATLSNGNPRRAISIIERGLNPDEVQELEQEIFTIEQFVMSILKNNPVTALQVVGKLKPDQTLRFTREVCAILEAIWLTQMGFRPFVPANVEKLLNESANIPAQKIVNLFSELQNCVFQHPNQFKALVMRHFTN